ncbi:hypothetical protein D3C72_1585430 [compost metagenome]
MVLAQRQRRDFHALRQLDVRQVHNVASLQLAQVDFDRLRQVLRQAADGHFLQFVGDHDVGSLASRRGVFVDEVQRNRSGQLLVLVHAQEVQVHDQLLERMALHVTQQHLLHLAVQVQVQDRGIEPLVLLGQPDFVVVQADGDRFGVAAVHDRRDHTSGTQAAARTLTLQFTLGDLDFMGLRHFRLLGCCLALRLGG